MPRFGACSRPTSCTCIRRPSPRRRDEYLAGVADGLYEYESVTSRDTRVRIHGDVAFIDGICDMRVGAKGGRAVLIHLLFVLAWVRSDGAVAARAPARGAHAGGRMMDANAIAEAVALLVDARRTGRKPRGVAGVVSASHRRRRARDPGSRSRRRWAKR